MIYAPLKPCALEALADAAAVLVLDETGFLEQGRSSCGVARQYTGSAGKVTDCQVGVFAAYASRHGHAFVDRALYLPKAWADDPARRASAHVPPEAGFATKPRLAGRMIERAIAAGVPFAWVAADSVGACPADPGAWARSRRRCAGPARGTCSGSTPRSPSTPGSASRRSPAPPRRSRAASTRRLAAPLGRRGDEGPAAPRLGLPGAGRPRRGRVRRPARRPVDAGPAGPPQPRRRRARLLLDLVPGRDRGRDLGQGRGAALGDRGRLRDRRDRARAGPQRDPELARLAPARLARHAGLRHAGGHPPAREHGSTPKNLDPARPDAPGLIRWSVQEIRRIAVRLAQRRIQPAHVIAWSLWRRAHQAAAQRSH